MFGFKKMSLTGLIVLSYLNLLSANQLNATRLSCISMNHQECKLRPEIVNVNSDELRIYPFSIKTSKCSDRCNNINDPYAKMCLSNNNLIN